MGKKTVEPSVPLIPMDVRLVEARIGQIKAGAEEFAAERIQSLRQDISNSNLLDPDKKHFDCVLAAMEKIALKRRPPELAGG